MSNDVAIRVEHLGKRYKVGARQEGYKTFSDSLTAGLTSGARGP